MHQDGSTNRILFDALDLATGQSRFQAVSPIDAGRRILRRWRPEIKSYALEATPVPKGVRTIPVDWGLVCRADLDARIRESLEPLIKKRQGQIYPYAGELNLIAWGRNLRKNNCALPADSMYLLLVGSPKDIPFDFEKMLTPQHAVGRLHLPDAEAYARYVETLLAYEADPDCTSVRRRHVEFYVPDDTPETMASRKELAQPLIQAVDAMEAGNVKAKGWFGDEVTREGLVTHLRAYGAEGAPGITFFASHGAEVSSELQAQFQGSWIPQGAPALGHTPSADELRQHYLTSDSFISGELSPYGSIVFNFACFGAGLHQEFTLRQWVMEDQITPEAAPPAIVSALGRGLLSNPRPALAYISTLDRKSNVFSLLPDGLQPFKAWIISILRGKTVGQACQEFWLRSTTLRQGADQLLEYAIAQGYTAETLPEEDAWDLAMNWIMAYELDNFCIQGDPAVHLNSPE